MDNKIENNKKDKTESDAKMLFIKNLLNEKTVIALLTGMIAVLLLYIVGSQLINTEFSAKYIETQASDEATEQTAEATTTPSEIFVCINSDDLFELTLLPEIGETRAQAILDYRKENGDFTKIEELKNVKGIGDKVFDAIKDYIFID